MGFPKTTWVFRLPDNVKREIWEALEQEGLSYEDKVRGMDGRLCDLEDTVDVSRWLQ